MISTEESNAATYEVETYTSMHRGVAMATCNLDTLGVYLSSNSFDMLKQVSVSMLFDMPPNKICAYVCTCWYACLRAFK